jgi:hypothetical protein
MLVSVHRKSHTEQNRTLCHVAPVEASHSFDQLGGGGWIGFAGETEPVLVPAAFRLRPK